MEGTISAFAQKIKHKDCIWLWDMLNYWRLSFLISDVLSDRKNFPFTYPEPHDSVAL